MRNFKNYDELIERQLYKEIEKSGEGDWTHDKKEQFRDGYYNYMREYTEEEQDGIELEAKLAIENNDDNYTIVDFLNDAF